MATALVEMAAEIAAAQASHAVMSAEEVEQFLKKTFQALQELKAAEEGQVVCEASKLEKIEEAPALLDPKKSIQKNKVICLECGKEFKQITEKHMLTHDLTGKEYRKKHGFKASQPLSAKTLSAARRQRAKELGLGDKLKKGKGKNKKKQQA
jgi:predicted transcriptional regulator